MAQTIQGRRDNDELEDIRVDDQGQIYIANPGTGLTDAELRATPLQTLDNNKQGVLYYAEVLTASTTLTPTAGKRLKIVKMQVLQNPDNSSANQVTLNFTSTGDFFTGWAGADSSEIIGAVDESLNITLANTQQVSVMLRYKEI